MTPKPNNIWEPMANHNYPWERRKRLLVYLWQLVPGTTDAIQYPDRETKKAIYDRFIQACEAENLSIPHQFRPILRNHGYPFDSNSTLATENGKVWAKALALAAHQLRVGVKKPDKNKTAEAMGKEVKEKIREAVFDEWFPILDDIFKSALKLWEAEIKEDQKAREAGPQTLDE